MEPLAFALCAGAALCGGIALAAARPAAIVDHPRTVLALVALVSLAALAALVRLDPPGFRIDIDPASEPLLRRDDPGIPVYRQAVRDFGSDDVYVVAMHADDVFTVENLEALWRLTNHIRALSGVASAESLARVLSVRYDPEDRQIEVSRLMERVPREPAELASLRERALADPVYRKTLVAADGRTAAINVTFQPMTDGDFVQLDLDGRIEALLEEESAPGRRFYVAGRPHVRAQAYHLMVGDLATLVPVAVAVAAVTLWLMGGSLPGVLLPLVSCLTSTLWVFGAMAALSVDINLITLVIGSLLICVGSVYGVHVYARHQVIVEGVHADLSPRDAALDCLRYARTPVVMAGFTTCIGFGALLLTDIQATNELGAFSILGVASVTLLSLTGVPAALAWIPGAGRRHAGSRASERFGSALEAGLGRIAAVSVGHPTAVLAASALLALGAAFAIPRIAIDTDVITFFLEDSRVRTDFAAVNELLTGAVPIYVLVSGSEEGAFREPVALRAIESLQRDLERIEGVSQVLSAVDLIRIANRAMHEGRASEDRIPDTRAAIAEATFVLPKAKLRRFSTSDHGRANLIVRTGQAGSAAVRALEDRLLAALERSGLAERFETGVTGNAVLLNRSADGIAGNQATQVGFAAGAMFLLICAVFRSVRTGLIAMVPNVVPVWLFFGVLGVGAAPLSLPTSLIGSIALGIAIDDTMHFLVAYRSRRREGTSPEAAAAQCIRQVGRPIVMTSIMLVVGFLVILASGFATLREFGALTALTMGLCLATDLLLLPALLVKLRA
jgi:predicted RND superfamily exporter protein